MGAALAYYTMFSLAPLLLLVIAVAGLVFGVDAARGQIVSELQGLIGKEGAVAIQGLLKAASQPGQSIIASAIGLVTLVIGATSIFGELQSDLDRIWRAPAAAQTTGLWALVRTRFLSLGLVVSIGFLLLVSLALSAMLSALGTWWGAWFGGWAIVLQVVNQVVSFGIVTVLFALMYRILPRVAVGWHDVWIGSAATALLFSVGKFAIGLYLGKAAVSSGFGAAGSIVVLLVWVYYSSQLFLFGAEFTWVYAHRHEAAATTASGETTTVSKDEAAVPQREHQDEDAPRKRLPAAVAAAVSEPPTARDFMNAALVSAGFAAVHWYVRSQPPTPPVAPLPVSQPANPS
jgi:membrane protein